MMSVSSTFCLPAVFLYVCLSVCLSASACVSVMPALRDCTGVYATCLSVIGPVCKRFLSLLISLNMRCVTSSTAHKPNSIHPLVIFLRPADATAIGALLEPHLHTPEEVARIAKLSENMENEFAHIFDVTVDCGASIAETVRVVARTLKQRLIAPYWFESAQELPLLPGPAAKPVPSPSPLKALATVSLCMLNIIYT